MQIRFYGHACFHIQAADCSVAIDPWFSKSGAFLSSWFQFPDNTDLDLEPIRDSDFIVITHEHQDHLDLDFLKTINPNATIVIPKYTDSYLHDSLRQSLPNKVLILNSMQRFQLAPEINLCLAIQSVPIWDDCSVILETPEGTIVDVNDMKITGPDLERIKKSFKIKYLLMQFAPSAWHPYTYHYSDQEKGSILRHKTRTRFKYAKDIFLSSGAEWFIPSAGPPCFLDEELFESAFLDECVFSALPKFYDYARSESFAEKICLLMPGDPLKPEADYTEINKRVLQDGPYSAPRDYLSDYKKRREALISAGLERFESPGSSLLEKCRQHFEPLIASSPYFRKRINGKLLLEIAGRYPEKILVDFSKESDQVKIHECEDYSWMFRIESRFLDLIFQGRLTWEELFLSRRFHASRDPDIYNEFLIVFLRFRNKDSFRAYEVWEENNSQEEMFELTHEGKHYKVQKYCPHARGDLSKGRIIRGEIVCPGHGWTFSLENGRCAQNTCSIDVREFQGSSELSIDS